MNQLILSLESGTILLIALYCSIAYFAIVKHNIFDIMYALFLTFYFLRMYKLRRKQVLSSLKS